MTRGADDGRTGDAMSGGIAGSDGSGGGDAAVPDGPTDDGTRRIRADGGAPETDGVDVVSCTQCPRLAESRSRIVNGVGPADADLLFAGEAPGANEDERGEPFVGRSGDVLDDALAEAGIDRGDVRITNCVRCRPPDNRDPTREELGNCRGHLERELVGVDPELVVTLGKVPSEHLLERSVGVTSEAGDVVDVRAGGRPYRAVISVHPAATLYDGSQRETFFETVARAAEIVGIGGDDDGGQSSLDAF